jgi:hypothetical protein
MTVFLDSSVIAAEAWGKGDTHAAIHDGFLKMLARAARFAPCRWQHPDADGRCARCGWPLIRVEAYMQKAGIVAAHWRHRRPRNPREVRPELLLSAVAPWNDALALDAGHNQYFRQSGGAGNRLYIPTADEYKRFAAAAKAHVDGPGRGGRRVPLRRLIDLGDDTLAVPLTDGYTALIDAADRDLIEPFNWTARVGPKGRVYVFRKDHRKTIYLHRVVMGLKKGDKREVDHVNSDPLDNRRANLRIATRRQNAHHTRAHSDGSSRFVGVSWHRQTSKWRVCVGRTHVGLFSDEVEAAKARDALAREMYGEWAVLNFPGS